MEELGSFWNYPENMDHVQQKLVCTTLALEAVKKEANDELNKYKQYIKHLTGLLKVAYQERDNSRNQLQKVLDNLTTAPTGTVGVPCLTRANSSITESNNSYGSPTVDSFASSPDSTNMAAAAAVIVRNQPYNHQGSVAGAVASVNVIDDLCRGLALPQKGSLLKVVMDSGPLLSSLFVSGPLPQWKNPPPLQPLKIPTFPINVSPVGHDLCSTVSMVSFGAGSSRVYQNDDRVLTSAVATAFGGYAPPTAKRQRFQ